jgi:hypothetical protein
MAEAAAVDAAVVAVDVAAAAGVAAADGGANPNVKRKISHR